MPFVPNFGELLLLGRFIGQCPSEAEHDFRRTVGQHFVHCRLLPDDELPQQSIARKDFPSDAAPKSPVMIPVMKPPQPPVSSEAPWEIVRCKPSWQQDASISMSLNSPKSSRVLDRFSSSITSSLSDENQSSSMESYREESEVRKSSLTSRKCSLEHRQTPQKDLSPDAEDSIRIMEWSKRLVIESAKEAAEEEKEMNASSRFALLLRKWKTDALLRRDTEDADEVLEEVSGGIPEWEVQGVDMVQEDFAFGLLLEKWRRNALERREAEEAEGNMQEKQSGKNGWDYAEEEDSAFNLLLNKWRKDAIARRVEEEDSMEEQTAVGRNGVEDAEGGESSVERDEYSFRLWVRASFAAFRCIASSCMEGSRAFLQSNETERKKGLTLLL